MLLVIVTWLRSFYKIKPLFAAYLCSSKETFLKLIKMIHMLEIWLVN